ncbi:hypothetical protein ACP70R_023654 [Stipagrostis hirtigluma subsp. patula]
MSTNFSFPEMSPPEIAEALNGYGLAYAAELRPEDIANPPPDLLPNVLNLVVASIRGDDGNEQLGFEALQGLENPEHHANALQMVQLYQRARGVLESIQFRGLAMRDLLRPDPRRVVHILSAVVNFLHFREDKLVLLQPIVDEYPNLDERGRELDEKIAEHQKVIADHELKVQMDEPEIQRLKGVGNGLKQKIQEYIKQHNALQAKSKAIQEQKEEIRKKITQADFELTIQTQKNSELSDKIVQSPEKLQDDDCYLTKSMRALEEKKSARAELRNLEKMAKQNVQEKEATLEMCTKAYEKLLKQFSRISALHEQMTAAKTVEKEVKAFKAKISEKKSEMMVLDAKYVEWERKESEALELLRQKEKEKEQRIADNEQKLATLKSEVERELQCLEARERNVEEVVAKATDLCSQADSVGPAAQEMLDRIFARYQEICDEFERYLDSFEH